MKKRIAAAFIACLFLFLCACSAPAEEKKKTSEKEKSLAELGDAELFSSGEEKKDRSLAVLCRLSAVCDGETLWNAEEVRLREGMNGFSFSRIVTQPDETLKSAVLFADGKVMLTEENASYTAPCTAEEFRNLLEEEFFAVAVSSLEGFGKTERESADVLLLSQSTPAENARFAPLFGEPESISVKLEYAETGLLKKQTLTFSGGSVQGECTLTGEWEYPEKAELPAFPGENPVEISDIRTPGMYRRAKEALSRLPQGAVALSYTCDRGGGAFFADHRFEFLTEETGLSVYSEKTELSRENGVFSPSTVAKEKAAGAERHSVLYSGEDASVLSEETNPVAEEEKRTRLSNDVFRYFPAFSDFAEMTYTEVSGKGEAVFSLNEAFLKSLFGDGAVLSAFSENSGTMTVDPETGAPLSLSFAAAGTVNGTNVSVRLSFLLDQKGTGTLPEITPPSVLSEETAPGMD